MPFHTLKTINKRQEKHPGYNVIGTFEKMLYLAIDIRWDRLKENSKYIYENKTDNEILAEFKIQLEGLRNLNDHLIKNSMIENSWLVATPIICDHVKNYGNADRKSNIYAVTALDKANLEEFEKLISQAGTACGEAQPRPDKRRRLASQAEIGVYVALELKYRESNPLLHEDHSDMKNDIETAFLNLSLTIGETASLYINAPIRMFLQHGATPDGPRFVEQYMNSKISTRTNGFRMGEGYIRGLIRGLNRKKISKYVVFCDMFESTGAKFSLYGLSKEELLNYAKKQ
jgi:hypothetical protein